MVTPQGTDLNEDFCVINRPRWHIDVWATDRPVSATTDTLTQSVRASTASATATGDGAPELE